MICTDDVPRLLYNDLPLFPSEGFIGETHSLLELGQSLPSRHQAKHLLFDEAPVRHQGMTVYKLWFLGRYPSTIHLQPSQAKVLSRLVWLHCIGIDTLYLRRFIYAKNGILSQ